MLAGAVSDLHQRASAYNVCYPNARMNKSEITLTRLSVHLRLTPAVLERVKRSALAERRSVTDTIALLLEREFAETNSNGSSTQTRVSVQPDKSPVLAISPTPLTPPAASPEPYKPPPFRDRLPGEKSEAYLIAKWDYRAKRREQYEREHPESVNQ